MSLSAGEQARRTQTAFALKLQVARALPRRMRKLWWPQVTAFSRLRYDLCSQSLPKRTPTRSYWLSRDALSGFARAAHTATEHQHVSMRECIEMTKRHVRIAPERRELKIYAREEPQGQLEPLSIALREEPKSSAGSSGQGVSDSAQDADGVDKRQEAPPFPDGARQVKARSVRSDTSAHPAQNLSIVDAIACTVTATRAMHNYGHRKTPPPPPLPSLLPTPSIHVPL